MKIGLLGGTFDPIHNGHLAIAKTALKRLRLDQVWFIPSLKTPLKDRELTPFELRVIMMEKALRPYRKMKLCLIEKRSADALLYDHDGEDAEKTISGRRLCLDHR